MILKAIRFFLVYFVISIVGVLFYDLTDDLIGIDFDAFFLYQPSLSETKTKIIIVKIDNESLDFLVKTDFRILSLSKKVFIATIDQLRKAGAKTIGIDVILTNPDPDEKLLASVL